MKGDLLRLFIQKDFRFMENFYSFVSIQIILIISLTYIIMETNKSKIIALSNNKAQFIEIHQEYSKIGDADVQQLLSQIQKSSAKVIRMHLQLNKISWSGIQALSMVKWHYLIFLNLRDNKIGSLGCKYIARSSFVHLQSLNLKSNRIESRGLLHFSKNQFKSLKWLILGNNWIGCEGIGYFNKISLALNKISLEGNILLEAQLRKLFLQVNNKLISLDLTTTALRTSQKKIFLELLWNKYQNACNYHI